MNPADPSRGDRIVHVPRRFVKHEWGGTETVVLEISKIQERLGNQVEIFTSLALSNCKEERIEGIRVRRFSYLYPYLGLSAADRAAMDKKGGNLLSVTLLMALVAQKNVRIFHAHTLKRLGGEVRAAARLLRKPYVVTLHGGVFDVAESERQSMQNRPGGTLEWGKLFGALVGSRRVLDDADHVLCVGQGEFELARKQVPHDRISYLPNGVHPERFALGDGQRFRAQHGLPPDMPLLLNVGRIDRQKNQELLLRALLALGTERRVHLVLMGPVTQPDYGEKLRAFIAEHGLGTRVTFLPAVAYDSPGLADAYHACDVFVLPSIHEPFGIVVLEAWSSGKPVVVSSVGGLRALVEDGVTGLFVDPNAGDAVACLAARLAKLLDDGALARQLGENGRERVRSQYTWDAVGARLNDVYEAAEERVRSARRGSA